MLNRTESLKDSIEDTEKQIQNINIVIQQLEVAKDRANRLDEQIKIQELISDMSNDILFLEDIKEDDEKALSIYC